MSSSILVELGGSSSRSCLRDATGRYWFTPGVVREPGRGVALACPGIVSGRMVRWATNLGWPDLADPGWELGLDNLVLVVNDAHAAALGESILRAGAGPDIDLVYVSLGTGVGSAIVEGAEARDVDLGHRLIGGTRYCDGCRAVGCLNSELASASLPARSSMDDEAFVAETLARALSDVPLGGHFFIVLGGGFARRCPRIGEILGRHLGARVEPSGAPDEAKSAAYHGLDLLAQDGCSRPDRSSSPGMVLPRRLRRLLET